MDCLVINGYATDNNTGLVFHRTLTAKMDDEAAREDACREYQSSLEDLTFNSKPHINMLTILAEENLHFAKDIVAIIEAQINKARTAEKLPVLYLVDSIVKNVGGEYLAVFTKNLVTSFICVFEKVDENTRKSLFKLRSTWDDIFPLKKLYALDVRVNSHDPAWPIKPLPPTVNASIHVNPKFLKQAEEVTSPKASPPQPVAPAVPPPPSISEASITQEQLIRQQLLSKQKQLLELQHKKIELELEQTKAQLAANVVLTLPSAVNSPALNTVVPKSTPPAPVIKPWIPPPADGKPPTRDPRLNRVGPQHKEQSSSKKDSHTMGVATHTPEKRLPEKSSRPERTRLPKKELFEEKPKAKSPSPMAKGVLAKSKHLEAENVKSADAGKKDPRLRKHQHEKGQPQEEEAVKEKKRCTEKKEKEDPVKASELQKAARGKLVNGSVGPHDRSETQEKSESKAGGNARTNARKRTRSRSRSRSPSMPSPKRKERRSPKGRARSDSTSPPPSHKPGKARLSGGKHSHTEDSPQHGKGRDERAVPKKSPSEPRRPKRSAEERHPEARDSQSPRTHSESKDSKENSHRWKSGWEENKHLKLSEEAHGKATPQRHKSYPGSQRPATPRTPKQHRLSVDANLQIPEALNSVSKRDLLRKASIRLENGEISKDDFLNVAHQIKQLFQYQEEKQRSDSWEGSAEDGQKFPAKKKPLLATPTCGPTQQDALSDAELSYYEHKSRLRKTQLPLRQGGGDWDADDSQEEGDSAPPPGEKGDGSRGAAHPSPLKFPRPPRERRSKERVEEQQQPPTPMIEEYNHGREFPMLKSLQGLRFRRRADPRDPSASDRLKNEREWNSPLSERQRYDEREEQKSGYDAPRRYGGGPDLRHDDPGKHNRLPPRSSLVHRSSAIPSVPEGPARKSPVAAYERERLSPLEPQDAAGLSPVPRFESPTSEHSDDGPLELPRPILKAPTRGPLSSARQHSDSPGHTPPHVPDVASGPAQRYDGPKGHPSRYDGPGRHQPPGRFEGGSASGRFEGGPGGSHGPARYDGPPQQGPGRFDGPGRFEPTSMSHGPMRGGEPQGAGRYDGPAPQGPGRYDAPIGQQPSRFDGQGPGPGPGCFDGGHMQPKRFDGPGRFDNSHMQSGPGRFEGPMGFQPNPIRFDGPPNQPGPIRFDGPGNTPGPIRFDPPGQAGPMRFDMHHQGMPQRYDGPSGQQGPPRFCGPPNMQPSLRPGVPMYDPMSNSGGPQQPPNFNMPNQRFPEPINPQFSATPLPFPGQQNAPQGGNFNVPPVPTSSGFPNSFCPPVPPFYTPGAPVGNMNAPPPAGNMTLPMNMLPNLGQPPFLPPNPVPFSQPAPQFPPPDSHFGQVDVNDLLSKLMSHGIIKSAQTETTPSGTESAATPPAPPAAVEEEEEEEQEEDDDVPDLTGFVIEDMKQRYDSVVTKLYTGIQCYSCGMRFTASQTDVYADHLDWHYRQNRSEKDISKKVTHRRWYYSLMDWIEFEEIADLEERAKSLFFEKVNEEVVQKTQEAAKEKEFQSVRAAADVVDESCEICQEPFEMYWEEEEEEWHLKNAIRDDEKTYHPSCFEDYKNTSSFLDCTPSPNKLLTENPLSAFVKQEEEEEQSSCCAVVKQEMEAEVGVAQNLEEIQVKMEDETQISAIS